VPSPRLRSSANPLAMVVTAPRMRLTPSLPSGPDPAEGSSPSESCAARANLGRSDLTSNDWRREILIDCRYPGVADLQLRHADSMPVSPPSPGRITEPVLRDVGIPDLPGRGRSVSACRLRFDYRDPCPGPAGRSHRVAGRSPGLTGAPREPGAAGRLGRLPQHLESTG
jgi:hypothetical protein